MRLEWHPEGLILRAFAAAPGLKAQGGREHTKCSLLNANNGIVRVVCRSLYPGHTRYARKVPRVSLTRNRRGTLLARILEKLGAGATAASFRDIRSFARIARVSLTLRYAKSARHFARSHSLKVGGGSYSCLLSGHTWLRSQSAARFASDETLHIDLPKHSANAHRRRRALNSESSEGLARPLRHEAPTRATSATTRCESAARRRRHHRRGPSQPLSNLLERAPPPPPPRPPHTG